MARRVHVRSVRAWRAARLLLSAAAVLVHRRVAGGPPLKLLLLPDVGTLPVASYRPVLGGLMELRQAQDVSEREEPLLVVAAADPSGSRARVEAWRSLLHQVARRAGEQPLHAELLQFDTRLAGRPSDRGRPAGQAGRTSTR